MDQLVDQMTAYATEMSYEELPPEVVDRTKRLILDSVGCALGAFPSPPATIARAMAEETGSNTPATVLVGGQKTSPDLAAFANGVMIRYLDYSDVYWKAGVCHPSDMLGPTLAVADALHADGKSTILGTVLGYELLCSLVDSVAVRERRGWDQAIYGVISAAALAGKLLGLDREQMGHAISLAISSHLTVGQVRGGEISHWKGCSVANASRNAVFSAMLAAKGMTGPDQVFEGQSGFFNATGGAFELLPFGGKEEPFRIMDVRVKPYPSGYPSHTAIEAAMQIHPKLNSTDDIKEIRVQASRGGMGYASDESRWKPETRESADHSLPFTVAMALMEGGVEIRHFDEGYFKRPGVRALMQKVRADLSEECERAGTMAMLTIVDVELNSGELLSGRSAFDLARAQSYLTDEGQEHKFRPMAEALLPEEQVDRLLEQLRGLEQVGDIGEVLALTVPPG